MKRFITNLAIATLLAQAAGATDTDGDLAHTYINLSFKLLKTDLQGPNPGATQAGIDALCIAANVILDQQQRGWRVRCVERIIINPSIPPPRITYYTGTVSYSPFVDRHPTPVVVSLNNWYQWYSNIADGCAIPEPKFSGWPSELTPKGVLPINVTPYSKKIDLFNASILASPGTFNYRTDVGNVYIIDGSYCGGYGTFPNNNHAETNIFVMSGVESASLFIHELGHFSNLEHTFASNEVTYGIIGDETDALSDTLPDIWDFGPSPPAEVTPVPSRWNSLANRMYGIATYNGLDAEARSQVRVMAAVGDQNFGADPYTANEIERIWQLWENMMSYHKGADPVSTNWLLTDLQMDRWTDAYALMRPIATGRHWFFGAPTTDQWAPFGTSKRPHPTIAEAVNSANTTGGDIVIGRPGLHPVPGPNGTTLRISKPMCLRATKAGAFSIVGH